MPATEMESVFKTDKRIKLGLWGLGRGLYFHEACAALNLDVVAGCDFLEPLRDRFSQAYPEALVTDNADELLSADIDAVLLATYCPGHTQDAIRCLDAGKHVLAEVTAFHTMAEGVRLVEAVERSGLVYNLAENYPFTAPQMYLARKWREGLFGDLMYAEGEYLHEIRALTYTYLDGQPVEPGYTVHNWRSWIHPHYYCTHSLGPIMNVTGARPTRVVALPCRVALPADGPGTHRRGAVAPSLITMDNGALVRNLIGFTTNDSLTYRYWGTRGAAEVNGALSLRLGAAGESPKMQVETDWGEWTSLARKLGHGGGDFWVLYYFAREILEGETAPFDIYTAADCTIPGILAYRSSVEDGKPYAVPDLRRKDERDLWRADDFAQPRYDVEHGCFPDYADKEQTKQFTTVVRDLLRYVAVHRAAADWVKVQGECRTPEKIAALKERAKEQAPEFLSVLEKARRLAEAYPESDGAHVLRELFGLIDENRLREPR